MPRNNQRQPRSRRRRQSYVKETAQRWWFTSFVQFLSLFSGILTVLVGVVHAGDRVEEWCEATDDLSCIGTALFWSEGDFLRLSNGPGVDTWGSVFSLEPNILMDNFAPVFVGLITLSVHLPGEETWNPIGRTWTRYFIWFLLVALFANVGYAGNLGLVIGLFNVMVASTCLTVRFSNEERRPTDLDVIKETRSCRCFAAKLTVLVSIGRMLTMLATGTTVAVGLLHLFSQFTPWCDKNDEEFNSDETFCVGPLLFWGVDTNTTTVVDDRNVFWREVVGLTPKALANNFAPLIIGIMMMLGHRRGSPFQVLLHNWYRVSLLCVLVALFASFGFAGNAGVINGFLLSGTSVIHMFVALLDADVQRPFLEVQFQFLAPDNANEAAEEENRRSTEPNSSRRADGRRQFNRNSGYHGQQVTTSDDESQSGDEVDVKQVAPYHTPGFLGRLSRRMSSSSRKLDHGKSDRERKKNRSSRDNSRSRRGMEDIEEGRRSRSRPRVPPRDSSRGKHGEKKDGKRSSSRARDKEDRRSSSKSRENNRSSSSMHRHVSHH